MVTDIKNMDIIAVAQQVSREKMIEINQAREIMILQKTLDNQEMMQEQLLNMLQQIQPLLGNSVNLLV